jgi:hypothetical protein
MMSTARCKLLLKCWRKCEGSALVKMLIRHRQGIPVAVCQDRSEAGIADGIPWSRRCTTEGERTAWCTNMIIGLSGVVAFSNEQSERRLEDDQLMV